MINFHPMELKNLLKIINNTGNNDLLDYLTNDNNYSYDARYNLRFINFDNVRLDSLTTILNDRANSDGELKDTANIMIKCLEASKLSLIYARLGE